MHRKFIRMSVEQGEFIKLKWNTGSIFFKRGSEKGKMGLGGRGWNRRLGSYPLLSLKSSNY